MAFSDWLIIGALGMFVKKGLASAAEEREQREREYRQFEEERQKSEAESARRDDVDAKRKYTPCKFKDGITYEDFSEIANRAQKRIKRIKEINISGAVIYCAVESQTGYSDWDFRVDFNDWGHVTGTYWKRTENYDSNIPKHFGDMVSGDIHQLLRDRNIKLPEFSDYVDDNKELGTSSGLSYFQKVGFFKKVFSQEQQVVANVDSQDLLGEHIYMVISMLKSNGFKNIKSIPIKDVGKHSDKYIFEVEQVVVNGVSFFEIGDSFAESSEIIITYHVKQEITVPYAMNFFKKKHYITVGDQLQDMGFSNIYERKIKDLVTGWITKDGLLAMYLLRHKTKKDYFTVGIPLIIMMQIVVIFYLMNASWIK